VIAYLATCLHFVRSHDNCGVTAELLKSVEEVMENVLSDFCDVTSWHHAISSRVSAVLCRYIIIWLGSILFGIRKNVNILMSGVLRVT
jgi:hypothetical protein